jgi:predicted Zn-dependent protease
MDRDRVWYYPYTTAQYSVTVHDPEGSASGWAGLSGNDWTKLDAPGLTAIALDKCLRSRNPVAIEPGYYTAILEPQAVADFVGALFTPDALDRESAEYTLDPNALRKFGNSMAESEYFDRNRAGDHRTLGPYTRTPGLSKISERIIDERLSVSMDPMDPELSFPPFFRWQVFHPATWIKDGVLTDLAYYRPYAVQKLGKDTGGLPSSGSYRMSGRGETASIDDMIATTKRGVLVTRFAGIQPPLDLAVTLAGYTIGGLWLIENGKVTKPIRNFRFTESPLIALNKVEQVGVSKRVFHPGSAGRTMPPGYSPVMVPALAIRDFNFSSLAESI